MQEEFGPVVVVNPIDSESEVIAVANDVKYGLIELIHYPIRAIAQLLL